LHYATASLNNVKINQPVRLELLYAYIIVLTVQWAQWRVYYSLCYYSNIFSGFIRFISFSSGLSLDV